MQENIVQMQKFLFDSSFQIQLCQDIIDFVIYARYEQFNTFHDMNF